jgi:hypothetical protein
LGLLNRRVAAQALIQARNADPILAAVEKVLPQRIRAAIGRAYDEPSDSRANPRNSKVGANSPFPWVEPACRVPRVKATIMQSGLLIPTERPPTDLDIKRALLVLDQVHVLSPSDREPVPPEHFGHASTAMLGIPMPKRDSDQPVAEALGVKRVPLPQPPQRSSAT